MSYLRHKPVVLFLHSHNNHYRKDISIFVKTYPLIYKKLANATGIAGSHLYANKGHLMLTEKWTEFQYQYRILSKNVKLLHVTRGTTILPHVKINYSSSVTVYPSL